MRRSPERSYMMVVDCVWGRGGRGVRGDVVSGAFFCRFGGFEFSTLRLELEAHAHFVSAGVEVLAVDQG